MWPFGSQFDVCLVGWDVLFYSIYLKRTCSRLLEIPLTASAGSLQAGSVLATGGLGHPTLVALAVGTPVLSHPYAWLHLDAIAGLTQPLNTRCRTRPIPHTRANSLCLAVPQRPRVLTLLSSSPRIPPTPSPLFHAQFYRAYDKLLTRHMSKHEGIGHDLTLVGCSCGRMHRCDVALESATPGVPSILALHTALWHGAQQRSCVPQAPCPDVRAQGVAANLRLGTE